MNKYELARLLNGREYLEEMSKEEEKMAHDNDLIVIFGQSDDLVEFRGRIYDEIDAYDGVDFLIASPGELIPDDPDDENSFTRVKDYTAVPIEMEATGILNTFRAVFAPNKIDLSWMIIGGDGAPFIIYDDDQPYCMGVVVTLGAAVMKKKGGPDVQG